MNKSDLNALLDRKAFFIDPDDCITCGCCQAEAPTIFSWISFRDKEGILSEDEIDFETAHVLKQPETEEERTAAVFALEHCMVEAINYGGNDPGIIRRLKVEDSCPTEADEGPSILWRALAKVSRKFY